MSDVSIEDYCEMVEEYQARIAKLEAALLEIIDMPGEINLCNYHPDDVRKLNNAFIDCYHIASKALEE